MADYYYYNKEWERKKWYLTRKLLEDVPTLSPIPEVREPQHKSDTPDNLPDLTIEVIPRRPNVDESKEFYMKLEKEIRHYIHLIRTNYALTQTQKIETDFDVYEIEKSRSSSTDYESVETFKIPQYEDSQVVSDNKDDSSQISDELASNREASASMKDDDECSLLSPDVMRRDIVSSHKSLEDYKFDSDDSLVSKTSIQLEKTSIINMEMEPIISSTPKSSGLSRKRKHTKSSSYDEKRNKALQTSLSSSTENIWTHFFVGKQIVYKLCTCRTHECI